MSTRHIVGLVAAIIAIIGFLTGRHSVQEFLRGSSPTSGNHESDTEVVTKYDIVSGQYVVGKSIENERGLLTIDSVEVGKDGSFTIWATVLNTSAKTQSYYEQGAGGYYYLKNTFGKCWGFTSYGGVFDGVALEPGTQLKGWIKFSSPPKWQSASTYAFEYSGHFPPLMFRMPPQ